ncbi:1102_t:CDS:2 [Funneliformis geosporum]|uniref:631_t:CDS:1 n=1 Tax=Funneliformis geosporum TaxID=1117311 RepID=A0A9W4WSP8_9GLOM|nr:1102_t:CDS:2 [Funneliformis geosporum]CAI2175816.1 631_t:CDS:2 [Funneliformis geosporum]
MWTSFNIVMWLSSIFMSRIIWNSEAIPLDVYDFHSTQHSFQINEFNNKEISGKFLHITDLHLDPYYLPNSNPKKYCHRYAKKSKKNKSGKFGTLGSDCDSPYALLDSTFSFLKENFHDADFIIYTGDSLRHDRDSKIPFPNDDVISGHKSIVKYVTESLDLSKTKFIPTLGNNDEWEHNQLEGGPNTLFENLTQIWAPLNLNLTSEFANGGYFRQDINSKLSVFSLNSMYFYESNDQIKDCDQINSPGAIQLKWFKNQLKNARQEGRRVLIAQHIPPLDSDGESSFLPQCEEKFVQLLGEFAEIISGHFTGHTNLDTLTFVTESENISGKYNLYYLDKDEGPSKKSTDNIILILNNAPSIIPGKYSTSSKMFGVLSDYIQYYLDINKANEIGRAEWKIEYIASEAYDMKQLSPSEWAKVLDEMKSDQSESWQNYLKFVTVSSE